MLLFNAMLLSFQEALFSAVAAFAAPPGQMTGEFSELNNNGAASSENEESDTEEVRDHDWYGCAIAGEYAEIKVYWRNPRQCWRRRPGGPAEPDFPKCWLLAKLLGCTKFFDVE